MITVSVLMLTYNHEKYIEEAINGVLMQECDFNVELIIADDNSPDNTETIVKNFIKNHPKKSWVKYTRHKVNRGIRENATWTLQQARGNYIAICEGDDYWIDPLKLKKQVDFLNNNPDYGLVTSDFHIYNQSTGQLEESIYKNKPDKFPIYTKMEDILLASGFMAPPTWLYRTKYALRSKMDYTDPSFAQLLKIFANSKVHVTTEPTAVYRKLEESASHSKSIAKRYNREIGILSIQLEYIRKYDLSKELELNVLKKHCRVILPALVALGKKDEIDKALFYLPKHERTLKDSFFIMCSKTIPGKSLVKKLYSLRDNYLSKF